MCKVEVPGKVLVAIDCRTTLASNYCWGQEGLSCARYSGTFNIYCLLSPYLRAAAASLLSLKAQGADLEVITSVKRPPGIAEVRYCENQCVKLTLSTEMKKQPVVQVGLGIGTADLIGEAEAAFTAVQDPEVNYR